MANNFTQEDGLELAAYMIRDLGNEYATRSAELERDAGYLPDEQFGARYEEWRRDNKSEVLRRYLQQVQNANSPVLEQGFLSALSDILGRVSIGEAPDWEYYVPRSLDGVAP